MVELIVGAVFGLCFFIVPLWSYRRGLKDGLALKDNKPIEPIKTPLAVMSERTQAKEAKETENEQAQFISNLFGYSGEKQKEVN